MNAVKNINALMMNGKDGGLVSDSKEGTLGNSKRVSGHDTGSMQDTNYTGNNL